MKIAVVGAGAIGGLLAARLARSGEEVTVIARGAHLAAIRSRGLKLMNPDGTEQVADGLRATESCADAGPQDLVILAVKAYQIEALAPHMGPLFRDDTPVLTTQNGLPWWYFQNLSGPYRNRRLKSCDPAGIIEAHIEARRIIGCVVYCAGATVAPGVIKHVEGDRLAVGEPDGAGSQRVKLVCAALNEAGLKASATPDIRAEIWLKLWGNLSFNPVSALTHATLVDVCREPAARELVTAMMREAQAIAEKLGVVFRMPIEQRIAGAEMVGKHKSSTLQDVEAGRAIEVDALIGSVVELGELTGTPAPVVRAVWALLTLLARTMREQEARVVLQPRATG
jgi:2-dehydropantoate 2-reductase